MSQTEQEPRGADPFDPFGYFKAARDSGMEAWSKIMLDFVHSDAYARASAEWLDTYLAMSQPFQRVVDQAMTQTLGQCKLPSTDDIARLAERMWNIELRLDDLDARVDEVLALLREVASRPAPSPAPPARPAERAAETGAGAGDAPGKPTTAPAARASRAHANRSRNGDKGDEPKAEAAGTPAKTRAEHNAARSRNRQAGAETGQKGK